MNKAEYEEKKIKLNVYRDTLRRLERRSEEINRWGSISFQTTNRALSGIKVQGAEAAAMEEAITAVMQIRKEIDRLAELASESRQTLCEAIELLRSPADKEVLESIYLNGLTIEKLAASIGVTERTVRRKLSAAVVHMDTETDFFR